MPAPLRFPGAAMTLPTSADARGEVYYCCERQFERIVPFSSRPSCSDEFKTDAVNLVIASGRSPASVAPELGISVAALKRCVQLHREVEAGAGGRPDDPLDPSNYKALEARLRELERENDFLKEVPALFAQEQR